MIQSFLVFFFVFMGSKNWFSLGRISKNILHQVRGFFDSKKTEIRITKKAKQKIAFKHPEALFLIESSENFALVMEKTICAYHDEGDIAFIADIGEENYIFYCLGKNSHHATCKTLFLLNDETLNKRVIPIKYENIIFATGILSFLKQ